MDASETTLTELLISELNRMADNVISTKTEQGDEEIARWIALFQYTHADAAYLLTAHLNDVTRERIPDSHWELIAADLEATGHSRDSYEHLIGLKDLLASQTSTVMVEQKVWTLLKLGGLFRSAERVKEIAEMEYEPVVSVVEGEMGMGMVVWLDEKGKGKIEAWIDQRMAIAWEKAGKAGKATKDNIGPSQ